MDAPQREFLLRRFGFVVVLLVSQQFFVRPHMSNLAVRRDEILGDYNKIRLHKANSMKERREGKQEEKSGYCYGASQHKYVVKETESDEITAR